jgi:hypothetical protein
MFHGKHTMTKITDGAHMDNCPITCADIHAAEHIFGPNLGALKGKSVTKASIPVSGKIESVPPSIMERYQKAVMATDIMFINELPFLVTITCGIHFGTIEFLENRQVPTIEAS